MTWTRYFSLLAVLLLIGSVLSAPALYAVEVDFVLGEEDQLELEEDPDEYEVLEPSTANADEGGQSSVISDEPRYIDGYRQLFEWTDKEIAGLEAVLVPLQEDLFQLDTQLAVLDQQISRFEQQQLQVASKLRELRMLDERYRIQEQLLSLELKSSQQKLEQLMSGVYRIKRQYLDDEGKVQILQLFSEEQPSEVLFQDYLLEKIHSQMLQHFAGVRQVSLQMANLRDRLGLIQAQNEQYQDYLAFNRESVSQQQEYRQLLLREKQQEQAFFQERLELARDEQALIQERILELARRSAADGDLQNQLQQDFERMIQQDPAVATESLQWPVPPTLGISAHFHDKGYMKRFGFPHEAIDIPIDQLTPVKAAQSGRVIKVRDGGAEGYSYIQLSHRKGFSTVYGHLFSLQVQEGQMIRQGQVIGLSGGAIGTHGAGPFTTGPHLHFELIKDGRHVDPLPYLPQEGYL